MRTRRSLPPAGLIPDRRAVWWFLLGLELLLLLAPLVISDTPPICDLLNHEARLFILGGGTAAQTLSRFYAPDWHLVPNLGMDLLGLGLLKLFAVSTAGRILLALDLLLCLGGTIAYHRTVFRSHSFWPLAVGLVLYGGCFLMGFINFVMSTGLALFAAAAFRSDTYWLHRARQPVAVAFVLLLFLFHIFGLIFYLVLIGSAELAILDWRKLRERPILCLMQPARRLAAPALTAILLVILARHPAGHVQIFWPSRMQRITLALSPFVSYSRPVFAASLAVVAALVAALAAARSLRVPAATWIALAVLAAMYAVSPFSVASGNYIGMRFAYFIALLLFAGIDVTAQRRALPVAAGVVLTLLLLLRMANIGQVWWQSRQDLADMRRAGAALPPGSTVLVLEARPDEDRALYYRNQPPGRELPGVYSTFIYLPALWVIERQVFFPLIFTIPTLQPLKLTDAYRHLGVPFGVPPDYRLLYDPVIRGQENSYAPYTRDWQTNFDYVAILSSGRARHLQDLGAAPLRLISSSDVVSLYKVVR
jgi:hypothetical protein